MAKIGTSNLLAVDLPRLSDGANHPRITNAAARKLASIGGDFLQSPPDIQMQIVQAIRSRRRKPVVKEKKVKEPKPPKPPKVPKPPKPKSDKKPRKRKLIADGKESESTTPQSGEEGARGQEGIGTQEETQIHAPGEVGSSESPEPAGDSGEHESPERAQGHPPSDVDAE